MKKLISTCLAFVFALVTSVVAYAGAPPIPPSALTPSAIKSAGGLVASNSIYGDVAYNIKASNTGKIRAAMATSSANPVVVIVGDSTSRGQSTSGGSSQGANAWPMQMALALDAKGIPASANSIFGVGNYMGTGSFAGLVAADNRLSAVTGTIPSFGSEGPGGLLFGMNAASTFTFTPQKPVSSIDLVYGTLSGGGTFSWSIDGGAATQISTNATAALVRVNIASGLSLATHTVTITWVSGSARPLGIIGYNNTGGRRELLVFNLGISGAQSSGFQFEVAGQPYTRRPGTMALAPKLSLVELGVINDWEQSISVATSKANMKATCVDLLTTGDVILIVPNFDNTATGLTAQQASYVAAMYEIADELDIGLIDLRKVWLSYSNVSSLGMMSDNVHPNAIGYKDIGLIIARVLARVIGTNDNTLPRFTAPVPDVIYGSVLGANDNTPPSFAESVPDVTYSAAA